MTTVKSHRFPVSITWQEGRLTRASAAEKPDLEIATPPEFKHGIAGVWSPEDLLVASTAACYAVTLLAIAERRGVQLLDLSVDGTGHVERRPDGRLGFIAIELDVRLAVTPDQAETAERVARYANDACLVSLALSTPVDLYVHVEARELALA